MYEKQLIKSGLTEKQAKLYTALLEFGEAKAPDLARRAGLKRTTAYGILDELTTLGLASEIKKGKQKIFRAQDPRIVVELLENRKKEAVRVLPELESLFVTHQLRPQLQFFEGREGIKRIYEDTLDCRDKKIYQIVRVKDFVDFPGGDFSKEYIVKRAQKNIVAYALHPKSDDIHDHIYGTTSEKNKRVVRYLPPSMFYASMIMIYDDKVAMISTRKENFGFIIESKEFSNTLKAQFDLLWKIGSQDWE